MIIIKLTGGLGNQLFQYSLGRHLSYKNNCELKLDITEFKTYKLHQYSLSHFNISEHFASSEEINLYKKSYSNIFLKKINKFYNSLKPLKYKKIILENRFSFIPEILELKDGIYLDGYWQSEKYFEDIEDIIKKEITLKIEIDQYAQNLISDNESISLHIRRADYVTNSKMNKTHGTCSLEYYQQAINIITTRISNPHFFIFSDDIGWAKDNFKIDYPLSFIDHGTDRNYEDLILMSLCKHNIIANSSFSWWGAWLNNNPHKIVIAPQKWFIDNSKDTSDLLPNNWIKI